MFTVGLSWVGLKFVSKGHTPMPDAVAGASIVAHYSTPSELAGVSFKRSDLKNESPE